MMAVSLTNEDLQAGILAYPSYVQLDGIYALEKELISDTIGIVRIEKMEEIVTQDSDLFSAADE